MRVMIWDKKKGDFFHLFGVEHLCFMISFPKFRVKMNDGKVKLYELDRYELYSVAEEE